MEVGVGVYKVSENKGLFMYEQDLLARSIKWQDPMRSGTQS